MTSDFVDAAISGAIGVISRCIPPINPTDPECFHMLVDPKMKFVTVSLHLISFKYILFVALVLRNTMIGFVGCLTGNWNLVMQYVLLVHAKNTFRLGI